MSTVFPNAAVGGSSSKTPAQLMQEQHEAADHHPTVEEEVDEEDVQHPPGKHAAPGEEDPLLVDAPTNGMMSAKAAGKQKATEKLGVLDTQDEEAFPSLGPSKAPAPVSAPRSSGWAAAASKPKPNGTSTISSRPTSSGAPTPTSTPGAMTPTSSVRGAVNLPGRSTDTFEIYNADLDRKKSMKKVIDDVKKKYNVIVTTEQRYQGKRTAFIAVGPKARVTEALMYISKELTTEQKANLPIPSTVSPQIIGKGGQNINKLQTQFNVRINIEKDKSPGTTSDEIGMDNVVISGHAAGVRQAYEHISSQVKNLQPKVDIPVRNIPPEFYPFLAHRHAPQKQSNEDVNIKIPSFHTWQQQPPPRHAPDEIPSFVPHGDSHIIISGEQAAAQQARAELEKLVKELEQELVLEELTAEQILHPYIVGPRGMDPLEFMAQTGCTVVLPPPHHETEDIHLIGPRDRLDQGRSLVDELMSKRYNRAVDLQKHFSDAPQGAERHSRALAQYLQKRAIEREFENLHNAEIVFPTSTMVSPSWNVITNDPQKAMAARNELSKITQAYPTPRIQLVEIDPFFHPHLEDLHAESLQGMGVHMIIPDDGADPVVLVYEGPAESPFSIPRTRPTKAELADFEAALQQAEMSLKASIPHGGISVADMTVPRKHHDRVRRFVNDQPKPQAPQFPVQVDFGAQDRRREQKSADQVFLRGPSESDIAELQRAIEAFIIQAEQDELERGYTTTFDFNPKHVGKLVGRQGQNIQELKEKHDVEIETQEKGKVKVQGPQRKADACKADILRMLRAWEDEVNFVIKVDPKYHGMLVGRGGETLNKIQKKVNHEVRIDFPRMSRISDDASNADTASEVGGPRQVSDEIRIRGPKAKAEKVRDELLELRQYYEDNSYSDTVSVAQAQLPALIGKRGKEMDNLRTETGAQIDIPVNATTARVTIQIKGSKQAVQAAKKELQKRAKAYDDVVTKEIQIDSKYHTSLIGRGGSNIQALVKAAGAPGRSAEHVRFPSQGEDSNTIAVIGTQDVVDSIVKEIQAQVSARQNQVTEVVDVPTHLHRNLIGPGGSTKRKLEQDHGCTIQVPPRESGKSDVRISGAPDKVAALKAHLEGMAPKGEKGPTYQVPKKYHLALARNGQMANDLKRYGFRVDHQGQKLPQLPQPKTMPLITDERDKFHYDLDLQPLETDGSGDIPWVLIPNRENADMDRAKAKMDFYLDKAKNNDYHVGYLSLADPKYNRYVVGQNGKLIRAIRNHRLVDIQVPKSGESGPIVLHGYGPEQDDGIEGIGNTVDQIMKEIRAQVEGKGTTLEAWDGEGIEPHVGSPPFTGVEGLQGKIKDLEL